MTLFTKKKRTTNNHHYGDSMRWIEKTIDSCETTEQVKIAERMIWLFEDLYSGELPPSEIGDISRSLHIRSIEKWGQITEEKLDKTKKDKKKKDKKK